MCRPYGIAAKTTLQVACERGWCTQESFASFVNASLARRNGEPITRATVANWSAGRENMPGDAVLLLAEHCAPYERDVLDVYLAGARHRAVGLDAPEVTPESAGARMGRAFGQLLAELSQAGAPESPGGATYAPEELAKLRPLAVAVLPMAEAFLASLPDPQTVLPMRTGGAR